MIKPRPAVVRYLGLLLLAAGSAILAGCGKAPSAQGPPPPATVTVIHPVMHKVQSYYEYNGYLDSTETVQIRARVKGILQDVMFNEGDDIKEKTVLYKIDPREYESAVKRAEADIAKAEADIEKATADIASSEVQFKLATNTAERMKRVGASASGEELDKALAAASTAEANKKISEANKKVAEANKSSGLAAKQTALLNVEYTLIKAPITGRISRTLVTKGNLVGQTDATLLTTIVRMDKLFVYFDAPERDLVEQLRSARQSKTAVEIPIELGVATEIGFPHKGTIDFQENRVDPGTGTIRVRGRFDNPVGADGKTRQLYPGLFARVRVPSGPERELPVIPEEAIMTGQEGMYVYVLGELKDSKTGEVMKNAVLKRRVTVLAGPPVWRMPASGNAGKDNWTLTRPGTPAPTLRSVVALESGLKPSDVVIAVGLQKARPGAPVNPEEWTFQGPTANAPR